MCFGAKKKVQDQAAGEPGKVEGSGSPFAALGRFFSKIFACGGKKAAEGETRSAA